MFERRNTCRTAVGSCLATSLLSLLAVTPAHSAVVSFSGYLTEISEDNGTSVYAGAIPGSVFSGSFSYGDSPAEAVEIEGDSTEASWLYRGGAYGGVITDGLTPTLGIETELAVIDNWVLDADDASMLSSFIGAPVSAGTTVDLWALTGLSSGAYEDEDFLYNGMWFGIALYSLDGSLLSGLGFQNVPPDLNAADGGVLFIEDADAFGTTRLFAVGNLESATLVPVPAAAWLFGSGLLGLIGMTRRRRCAGNSAQ